MPSPRLARGGARARALVCGALAIPPALMICPAFVVPAARADEAEAHVKLEARLAELERKLAALEGSQAKQAAEDELAELKAAAEEEIVAGRRDEPKSEQLGFFGGQALQLLNALNPRITVFGDVLAPIELTGEGEDDGDDRITVREVEVDMRAAVDPYASAVVILAVEEEEPGEYVVDAEEAYVTLDTLPLGFRLKLGRFFPEIGNTNRLHTHDLPWSVRPLPNRDFVAGDEGEGYKEYGAQITWLAPKLGPVALTLYAYVLNGEQPEVLAGEDSDDPAWLGRAEAFIDLGATQFITLGGNLLYGFNDADGERETQLWAADFLYKFYPSLFTSVVLFGELYYLDKEVDGGREFAFGAWGGIQVQPPLGELWAPLGQTYFGARYDFSTYDQQVEDADQWAVSGYVSFYTTEFLRFRLGYEHRERKTTQSGNPDEDTVFFQCTFVFGSHPAEPFWFNR
jgi:hypothetical protein